MTTEIRWPAGLPQSVPFTAGFGREENTIRTDTDTGPAKVRRRYTAVVTVLDITDGMVLDSEQLEEFMHFYDVETQSGALPFKWKDAIRGSGDLTYRFREQPKVSFVVPGRYETRQHRVAFTVEILPS